MKTKCLLMMLAAALFALSASAGAREVAIDNAGFEYPVMADGGYQYDPDGWTQIGTTGGGVWNPGGAWPGYPISTSDQIPEGQQVGYVEEIAGPEYPVGLAQVLTETLTADTTYVLSVQVGNNFYYTSGDYVIELRAGGTVLADFGENAEENITNDTFELRTVTYNYDPADADLLGEPLEIRLVLNAGEEVDFDDVKLEACFAFDPSPADGATVQPASDLLLSWTNMEPNIPNDPVYVDVWFGTDPNNPGPNYTKVVDAGENTTSVQVDASVDGTYYWQVNTYRNGSAIGDPCEGCVFTFYVVSDFAPTVDAGVDMITWSGQPVSLDPTVVDDGKSDLSYLWTAYPDAGVNFEPNEFVEDPDVTITDPSLRVIPIVNAGFETPIMVDGTWNWLWGVTYYPEWGWGYYNCSEYLGIFNPSPSYYGGIAPEGRNYGFAYPYDGLPGGGFAQVLTETIAADTTYTLTVEVGNTPGYFWGGYKVQLLAGGTAVDDGSDWADPVVGGTLLAEDDNSLTIAENTFETVTVVYTPSHAGDPNVGLPIQIRLLAIGSDDTYETDFDDVRLTASVDDLGDGFVPVTLTLAVHDEANPTPVKDTMTIDVYDDECTAARIGKDRAVDNPGDFDEDCDTDLIDLSLLLSKWLKDTGLTTPAAKP